MIIGDTSGIFASLDSDDPEHERCRAVIAASHYPIVISPFVLAEIDYLLMTRVNVRAETAFLREVAAGTWALAPFDQRDIEKAAELIGQYKDLGIGLADASIAVLADRHATTRVLTLDHRHFRAITPLRGKAFEVLPKDGKT